MRVSFFFVIAVIHSISQSIVLILTMFAATSLAILLAIGQSTAFLAPSPFNTRVSTVSSSSLHVSENNYDDEAATSSRRDFFTKSTTTTTAAIATLLSTTSKPAIAEEVPTVVVAGATGQTG